MKLLVGCPVRDRAWIMETWFDAVQNSCDVAGVTPEYVFVIGDSHDGTEEIIWRKAPKATAIKIFDKPLPEGIDRSWTSDRLEFMVKTRNHLLKLVRFEAPDLFLSLDSDILLHGDTVSNLIESAQDYDAVAGKVYLHQNEPIMNWGRWENRRMRRGQDRGPAVIKTDILMAVKMMNPPAYNVDYTYHFQGEDLGWSMACRDAGLTLGIDTRSINKHCLKRWMLEQVDPRVGF